MQLNPIFITLISIPTIFFGFLIWWFWKDIMSFIFPDKWVSVTMLELDNNVLNWLQKKKNSLTFDFKGGTYNLFHVKYKDGIVTDNEGNDIKTRTPINNNTLYKEGRLNKFFYVEGQYNPFDYRSISVSTDTYMKNLILDAKLSDMMNVDDNFSEELIRKYGIYILIAFIITILALSRIFGG